MTPRPAKLVKPMGKGISTAAKRRKAQRTAPIAFATAPGSQAQHRARRDAATGAVRIGNPGAPGRADYAGPLPPIDPSAYPAGAVELPIEVIA